MYQIRHFTFFDKEPVMTAEENSDFFPGFSEMSVTKAASGRGQILIGDSGGFVHQFDRSMQINSFRAYEFSLTNIYQMKYHNFLITIGSDEEGINPVLKVWKVEKDRGAVPHCQRSFVVKRGKTIVPVSVVVAHEDLEHLAIGLFDGTVLLYKGNFTRERFGNRAPKILYEAPNDQSRGPITALAFKEEAGSVILFFSTSDRVWSSNLSKEDAPKTIFGAGCEVGGSVVSDIDDKFYIISKEKDREDDQPVREFIADNEDFVSREVPIVKGPKKSLAWFKNYMIVIGGEQKGASTATKKVSNITIYDVKSKLIAYSGSFVDIQHVVNEFGSVFVIQGDGKIFKLIEKDFHSKLEILFKKNLYEVAQVLAQNQTEISPAELNEYLMEIYTQWASRLYDKGSYNEAIEQYIKTIGILEPSHIIRKFLDSQRIHNLTAYLQALHEKELADKHHTTLLLNCYTKLKAEQKLDEFVEKQLNFDVETAIHVCRQAGYHGHALKLAQKSGHHDWYLKIQLEDLKGYSEALDYISNLPFADANRYLVQYGKDVVNHLPEKNHAATTSSVLFWIF